ncbi:psbP domain-containing protein 3, chloroplastic [Silene latifolia]|uniref:psbP domain-containing protein 3, chloroplastic n=1 Tax=Silene latifolia TaxID=37657 RepID=UPI003D775370
MSASTISAAAAAGTSSLLLSPPNCCFSFTSCIPTSVYSPSITRKQHTTLCCHVRNQNTASEGGIECVGTSRRREAMLQMGFTVALNATALAISSPARALEDAAAEFRLFSDDVNKYNISIPQDWEVGVGDTDGIRSITAFYPNNDKGSYANVSVSITGIGADFTRLESFGKVDEFAESLVNGLDRSWQRPPGIAAKLVDCKAKNGLYYLEYTLQKPGENRRHIYSAIGMASSKWYNRLYTVTGQFVEDVSNEYSSNIQKAVQSFRLN